MKKLNQLTTPFLFLLFFACSINSSAQYHPLIDENKEWVIKETIDDLSPMIPTIKTTYYFAYFDGDINWGTGLYKKFFYQQFFSITEDVTGLVITSDSTLKSPYPRGFLREDVLAKQVFTTSLGSLSEELLFDFSLDVGDTLLGVFSDPFNGIVRIDSLDSIFIDNDFRSIHYFDPQYVTVNNLNANYFIEGIGGPGGLGDFFIVGLGYNTRTEIVCYKENGDSLFGSCNYPNFVTSINDLDRMDISFKLYPNPGNEQLIVEHDLTSAQELSLEIFSIQGKKYLSKTVFADQTTIDTTDLPQGIYFVQLSNEQGIVATQKWVKTN